MRSIDWILLVLLAVAAPAAGQSTERDLGDLRNRWRAKSAEQRELLERRFRELKSLSPERRDELMERARRFRSLKQELRESASPEDRRHAASLSPERAEQFWRGRADRRRRAEGRALGESMAPEIVRELRSAAPERRRAMLRSMQDRQRGPRGRVAMRELGRRHGLTPDELNALEKLPRAERELEILRLKRAWIESRVREHGLPSGFSRDAWESMGSLDDEEWLRRARPLRERAGAPRGSRGPVGAERERRGRPPR